MKCKVLSITALLLSGFVSTGQQVLSLEECRRRAEESSYILRMAEEKKTEASELQKAALWQMLPRVSANGSYQWMQKSLELLSEEQKQRMQTMGTTVEGDLSNSIDNTLGGSLVGQWTANQLSAILEQSGLAEYLNNVGGQFVNDLDIDTRNTVVGAVTVTQPLFMGGKLRSLYRSAGLMREMTGLQYDKKKEEMLIGVDEAYWQVVNVKMKKELAGQYADLLRTLCGNVEEMVKAEVATSGDLLQVKVKLNEAEMQLTKASNGLILAKMLLAQRCGMAFDEEFDVAALDDTAAVAVEEWNNQVMMDDVWAHRNEMKMLRLGDSLALEGVRMARASLMPNLVFTGGYLVSNPNLFDGFEKKFNGTLMAGVALNVPIVHYGNVHALRAAKHKRQELQWQMEEAKGLIELQVNKLNYELELAYKKYEKARTHQEQARENLRMAEESFRAGIVSSSDLMAAQTAWMSARSEMVEARIEIEMDRLYLRQAKGE